MELEKYFAYKGVYWLTAAQAVELIREQSNAPEWRSNNLNNFVVRRWLRPWAVAGTVRLYALGEVLAVRIGAAAPLELEAGAVPVAPVQSWDVEELISSQDALQIIYNNNPHASRASKFNFTHLADRGILHPIPVGSVNLYARREVELIHINDRPGGGRARLPDDRVKPGTIRKRRWVERRRDLRQGGAPGADALAAASAPG